MSRHFGGTGEAVVASIHDSLCRRIRLAGERIRLARDLEMVARSRPDVLSVVPKGLEDILSYRQLADAGLAHATLRRASGPLIVLAATSRVWRRPDLRRRLLAVKRDAQRIGRRVVLVTKRGLRRSAKRCRGRGAASVPE
jgi:hypothetical protein